MENIKNIEDKVIDEFNSIKDKITNWGNFVDIELTNILSIFIENKRLQILPNYRVKDVQSYMRKAIYERGYSSPILDTEDKVGTRAVFLSTSDVIEAKVLILESKIWKCKIGKDFRDDSYHKPDVFGYQSLHLIVSPNDDYNVDANLIPLLTCEIQLRTLLQHTYAEIAHDSAYKGPYKSDREMLRVLAKSMALMETTDDHFCRIFEMMKDPTRTSTIYLKELIQMFKVFVPEYEFSSDYMELNDTLLGLLTKKQISIEDLKDFVNNNKIFLKDGIKPKNGLLLQQPAILLVAFYMKRYGAFLQREWPLSHDALMKVFQSFGIANGVIY